MNDLYPVSISQRECQLVRSIFLSAYQTYAEDESREMAISLALDAVWSNARAYQMGKDGQ